MVGPLGPVFKGNKNATRIRSRPDSPRPSKPQCRGAAATVRSCSRKELCHVQIPARDGPGARLAGRLCRRAAGPAWRTAPAPWWDATIGDDWTTPQQADACGDQMMFDGLVVRYRVVQGRDGFYYLRVKGAAPRPPVADEPRHRLRDLVEQPAASIVPVVARRADAPVPRPGPAIRIQPLLFQKRLAGAHVEGGARALALALRRRRGRLPAAPWPGPTR